MDKGNPQSTESTGQAIARPDVLLHDPKRTIIVAFSADPDGRASVPIIGFKIAKSLSDLTDAHIILHDNDRNVHTYFPTGRVSFAGSGVLFRALRRLSQRLFRDNWNLMSIVEFFDYLVFDLHAFVIARSILRRHDIDYVLRVNPVSLRPPSLLAWLPVPVFTGPHNGGIDWPPGFVQMESEDKTGSRVRFLGDLLHRVYRDWPRYSGFFVANADCANIIPRRYRNKTSLIAENGVEGVRDCARHAGDATRLLFVGRLVPFKGLRFVLRAMAKLPDEVKLTIVGDGIEREAMERLAGELGVRDRCHFTGIVTQRRLHDFYADAGVFVFPSIRETGGAVILEAMSHGLPCIVADWGGPAEYTGDTGLKLSVAGPRELEEELLVKLRELLLDSGLGRSLGRLARERVAEQYVWSRKAELLHRLMCERISTPAR